MFSPAVPENQREISKYSQDDNSLFYPKSAFFIVSFHGNCYAKDDLACIDTYKTSIGLPVVCCSILQRRKSGVVSAVPTLDMIQVARPFGPWSDSSWMVLLRGWSGPVCLSGLYLSVMHVRMGQTCCRWKRKFRSWQILRERPHLIVQGIV
jgi:hypothetical protein